MANVYESVKQAFGDLLAPQLEEIKGEIKALHSDLKTLEVKIDGVEATLSAKIDGVDGKLTARIDALGKEVAHIREMIDFQKRLTALETRMGMPPQ